MKRTTVTFPDELIKALNVWRAHRCLKTNRMPTFTDAVIWHIKKALRSLG